MDDLSPDPEQEVRRLRRCMLDLVSVLALPAVWSGSEPGRILETFLDALLAMLDLDFLYGTIRLDSGSAPTDLLRIAQPCAINLRLEEIHQTLSHWFGREPQQWPRQRRRHLGDREVSILPLPLGIGNDLGLIVAGSRRASFPEDTERLILCVAANQAAIGLQHALRLNEQKRLAGELDRRVAERTIELAEINEELQLQVGLLQHLPVSAWTLKPDGTPDFVNRVWLEFSGQTLDFVRSHPEAWMTAIHPYDREAASKAFWEGVSKGQDFAFETRSLRARDGVYRWHLQQAVVLRDAEGRVLKFVGTTTDIHDQKRAQEALRTSETNLRRVIDTIPTLSWCSLPDGPNEFLSKSWHDYTGLSPEEAHGWGWTAAFHPDDLPPLMKRWQEMLVSGEPGEIEARLRRHDGVYRWFLIRAEPFRDETGTIVRWYGTSTDIDDRKRAEEELARSEAGYRVVVETASDAVISIDETGTIILANLATKRIFGYAPEELIGKPLTVLMPEAMRALHQAGYKRYLDTGVRHLNWQGTEVTALRADGEEFPAEVSFGEMTTDGPKVFTGFIRDISEKKRAQEAVRASERNLRLTINTMPVLAWSALPDGSVDFFNQRWLDYTGLPAAHALGWEWSGAFHPDDLERISDYWRSHIIKGEAGEIEARLRRFDGTYRWFLFRANPLRNESGAIVKWFGTNTDIHDRKLAEEQVLRSEAFLAEAQRLTRVGSFSWRVAGGEIKWSEQLYRIFELDPGKDMTLDLIGSRVHPGDLPLWGEMIKRARGAATALECELRIQMPSGSFKYVHLVAHANTGHEGRLEYIGAIQDVTQRQLAEEALVAARSDLAKAARSSSLAVLTASIAHEVNQPLSGILTNAGTCLRMLDSNPANIDGARETARRTIRDANRASDVITRLRALFRNRDAATDWVDLNEAAREVIALSLGELQTNRVTLKDELADGLPRVKGDRIQLQQVILNLLRNASEAMSAVIDRPRDLLIKTELEDGDQVSLMVRDTGAGFDPTIADQLFDSFYTTKTDGMGIGLSVSRSIIEAHQGRLWAARNDGPGATFAFSLPRDRRGHEAAAHL
jgi:PAS domain S-box-containing protein